MIRKLGVGCAALAVVVACSAPATSSAPSFGAFTATPATATPPTATPTVAATRAPLLGDAVAAAVRASGIPVTDLVVFTAETDPNKLLGRPGQYIAKVSWKDPRVSTADLATIEVFPDAASLQARFAYIDGIFKSSPMLLQWMYRNEARLALLRLPKELTPDQAKQYEDWFKTL